MAVLVRRLGIYGVVAVIVVAITVVAIGAYRLYYGVLADTPEKAVRTYIDTLNRGDMMKLYDMTLGASGQTQAEFATMIGGLVKDKRINTDGAVPDLIGRQGNVYYYRVPAKLRTADGSYRLLPLLLETGQEGNVWRAGIYLPPAALPANQ